MTAHQRHIGGEMKGWMALVSAMLCTVAALAMTAVPASARVPGGQGLESFGLANCEGLGEVEIFGPPAEPAPTGYLKITAETGQHVVATRFELTFDGQVVFSTSFGKKAGLTTFRCTQTFEDPDEGTGVFTLTVAVVPPR
jgi:hypothetical protein